jgi:hypothetical protein
MRSSEQARRALGRALATAVGLLLAGTGVACADSATIAVTTASGVSDAVAGVPRIVAVSGVASQPERIYVKYRASGGAPCASSAAGDAGAVLGGFYAESVEGSFGLQDVITWSTPGEVVFCTWLSSGNAATITAPIAQIVAFRRPAGSIGATVRPAQPLVGTPARVDVRGSTEAPAAVFASVRAADGSPCPATYAARSEESLVEQAPVDGAFALHLTTSQAKAGSYLVCLWLARSASDPSPLAGPQSLTFVVAAPPCIVPRVGRDRRPATVRRRLRGAHCGIGRSLRIHSRVVRKGAVVRLGRRPRSRLPANTPIGLVISSGPRPSR